MTTPHPGEPRPTPEPLIERPLIDTPLEETPAPEVAHTDSSAPVGHRLDLPDVEWRRVSRKLIAIEFISEGAGLLIITAAVVFVALVWDWTWIWWPFAAFAVISLITAAFIPRRIRAIGYQLRADDLLFRRGIMWQRFVAVPYGRMQLVDINRGPLSRAFGLADLKFVTASASTGVVINGLPEAEAEGLRDHLVAVAESRRTGL
ncbi:PH domain-containing protein [Plantibacter sp. VKM Ac-2880]|uniref:PH domain-containing protein n=1 Tax=Plantibacter sp. VKM Ac-2880 TaxID=2783827 RepID=UPI0018901DAC|nr:PH domain-containing protein [Plantibacter sp. VKM Ac-2880]MBF4568222.1 PH domain-containing protein [Plantibacter sp. VKM Ac-2880]